MKKLLMLALVAGFAATLIGCGPTATTKPTTAATGDKPTEAKK
jgi:ABC-type Zn uptake system ZnuABC Zn-binding protein ZnuA